MKDFKQWDPHHDQTFDLDEPKTLHGSGNDFTKDENKKFTLDTNEYLALQGPVTTWWKGEFHLIKGSFQVGTSTELLKSIEFVAERKYSQSTASLFRSRADFKLYTRAMFFERDQQDDVPGMTLMDNSTSSFNCLSDDAPATMGGLTLNMEDKAQAEFNCNSIELTGRYGGGRVVVINDACLSVNVKNIVTDPGYNFCFSLGGYKNEDHNGDVISSTITISPLNAGGNFPLLFINNSPKISFNFDTNVSTVNKGRFVFNGLTGLNQSAFIGGGYLTIDGVPITADQVNKAFNFQPIISNGKETGITVKLK